MAHHERCYAAARGDCSTKITSEHPVSESVLRIFGDQTGVDIQGFSWMTEGKAEFLRYSRLGSKVLCSTHNAGLSELDEAAARFIRRIVEVNQHLATHKRRRPIPPASFDGHLIERWMTKVLCGLVASGQAPSPAMEPRDWRPPPWWLEVIYNGAPMPDACGLYFPVRPPVLSSPRPSWTVGPFGQRDGSTYGLRATFMDKVLFLRSSHRATQRIRS